MVLVDVMSVECVVCVSRVERAQSVPSPTSPHQHACVSCLQTWLLSRAQLGALTDFASSVDISIGEWAHAIARALGREKVQDVLQRVMEVYVRHATDKQEARVARQLPRVQQLRSVCIDDRLESIRAERRVLSARMRELQELDWSLQQLRDQMDQLCACDDPSLLIPSMLRIAVDTGLLAATSSDALELPCVSCDGHWTLSNTETDAACHKCATRHCVHCGAAAHGQMFIDTTGRHIGRFSEQSYDATRHADAAAAPCDATAAAPCDATAAAPCDATQLAQFRRLVSTSRNCPTCGTLVTRTKACPHMQCTLCHAHFNIETGVVEYSAAAAAAAETVSLNLADAFPTQLLNSIPHASLSAAAHNVRQTRIDLAVPRRRPDALLRLHVASDGAIVLAHASDDDLCRHAASLLCAHHAQHVLHEVHVAHRCIQQSALRTQSSDDWRLLFLHVRHFIDALHCASDHPMTINADPDTVERAIESLLKAAQYAWSRNGVVLN